MPQTARKHFEDDFQRVESIFKHGCELISNGVRPTGEDLLRHSVAMAVGALDAYLCDAYIDTLTRTLRAYRKGTLPRLPAAYAKTLLPAGPLLARHYQVRHGWTLRMAARQAMEKDNLLRVGRLKDLFNPALAPGQKLWLDLLPIYLALGRRRLTKHLQAEIAGARPADRPELRKTSASTILIRVGSIVQRRHDIVHNCDRPKNAIQDMRRNSAKGMLNDLSGFIRILDDHLDTNRIC